MTKARAALIGCGRVAPFHVAALRAAGFEVVAVVSRQGSPRPAAFAKLHGIPRAYERLEDLLESRVGWDALVIAVQEEAALDVLSRAVEAGRPILVEKPVSFSSRSLATLAPSGSPVIVGFNRRFYRTVQRIRSEVRRSVSPVLAMMALPESILTPLRHPFEDGSFRSFFVNSIHGIDMVRFIFGDLDLQHVESLQDPEGGVLGLSAVLRSKRGDLLHLLGNWQASANFCLTVDCGRSRYELQPLEHLRIFEGIDVLGPDERSPLRRYQPKLAEEHDELRLPDAAPALKPGFLGQAGALLDLVEGRENPTPASLGDACAAVTLAEDLLDRALRSGSLASLHSS